MITRHNKYIPTPAEKKLLETLVNPNNFDKNITEICKLAEVSRTKYYEAIKNPEFVDLLNKITIDIIKGSVHDVVKAMYKFATNNAKNHSDRKMLLEIAGIYTNTTRQVVETKEIKENKSLEDLKRELEELRAEEE